jgi:Na+-driven multidrug efflux pump
MAGQELNARVVANTLAIVTAIAYIICAIILWISKDLAVSLGNYLFHGIDIASIVVIRGAGYTLVSVIFGTIVAWISGYIFAIIYNKLLK